MHDTHDDETWLVKLANGDVRMMDVDQLDEAFQSGTIDENTLVRRDGAPAWVKLSDELGGESEPKVETKPEPARPPNDSTSTNPVAVDVPRSLAHDVHDDLEAVLRASKRRKRILGGIVAMAVVGALAAVTVVNVMRLRAHAPLAAEIATVHVAAPSDPEPEETKHETKKARPQRHRTVQAASSGATTDEAPASTVFKNGGDQYDPLNGKL